MSGIATAQELDDLLGPEIDEQPPENLVDDAPKSRPMGAASREVLARSRNIVIIPRKNTPERLKSIVQFATEMPVANSICMRANISTTTLKFWLQKSKDGAPGDGFDIVPDEDSADEDLPIRFHEAFENAVESGLQLVEQAMFRRAIGYREELTYQGRVIYKLDPRLQALGYEGVDAYLLDPRTGAPVPETVFKQDPDLMMFIAERRMKDKYGKNTTVDMNVKGGVLVVGMKAATSVALNDLEDQYRREGRQAVTFDEGDAE